ncbi:MAG: cell division protein FtsZ [Opitutaceae bacterium]|jgi:cell division protein FtsZ|nr:cell division protein FtsZ [Opitutaceae bacterium]
MSSSDQITDLPLPFATELLTDRRIAIKVIGLGGAGANAVDRLKMENLDRLQMAVINTDAQALASSPVQEKILIGAGITRGLGAGADPDLGRQAAEADREKILEVVKDCDLVFLIAGMGGGTGSGAAPTVAEIAAEQGAVVISFVTLPFSFEGGRRTKQADEGLIALRKTCDAVIPLPNDLLLQEAAEGETVLDSFARADEWIGRGVKSIWSMMFRTGLINLDFATLRQAFHTRGGKTLFGLACGAGEDPVAEAIENLKLCPLLATPEFARKADRLLVNIVGGTDLTLPKVNEIMTAVTEQFGKEAHVIMGAVIDETCQGRVELMVLGTSDQGARGFVPRGGPSNRTRTKSAAPFPASAGASRSAAGGASEAVREAADAAVAEQGADATLDLGDASSSRGAKPKAAARAKSTDLIDQVEISFGEHETRGTFEKSDKNLFEGQDLDVPTYLRQGLKLHL